MRLDPRATGHATHSNVTPEGLNVGFVDFRDGSEARAIHGIEVLLQPFLYHIWGFVFEGLET